MTTKVRRIALAVLVVLAATMYAWQQGPGIGTLSNYAAYIYGQVVTGAPFSSNSLGQIFSSPRVIDAAAYCSGGYNASLLSCNGGYDGVHGIGHGMCEAMIAALTVATPNGTGKVEASAFGGIQFIT